MKAAVLALALVAALLGVAMATDANDFQYNVTNGAFKMHSVDVKTSTGKFTAGAIATVTCSGEMESDANILAGTVKYQVWEFGVPQFTASGNTPYFKCTNKGCNTADPVALTTKIVNGVTTFTLQFSLTLPTMVKPEGTNMFKIVFWGVDQRHEPYDFSATIRYMLTSSTAAPAIAAAVPAPAAGTDYKYNVTNGAFEVTGVTMTTPSGKFTAGEVATVTAVGTIPNHLVLSGTVKYQVWEFGIVQFVASGDAPYFKCTNKGCDTAEPIALNLKDGSDGSKTFTLTFTFAMPRVHAPAGTREFKLVFWGTDQEHYPYDFSATIRYLVEPTAPALAVEATPAPQEDAYKYNVTDGSFKISTVVMTTPTGKFTAGEVATVTAVGTIPNHLVLSGTVKYQVWEFGIVQFVASGDSPYFKCTNKGCDTAEPVALTLKDGSDGSKTFTLTFEFTMPAVHAPAGTNQFKLVFWGTDQEHYPYDFSATVRYNVEAAAAAAPAAVEAAVAEVAAPEGDSYQYNVTNGAFVIKDVSMSTPSGTWTAGQVATVTAEGMIPKKTIWAGALKYQVWEFGIVQFVASGNSPYFQCTNKGCDTSKPVALDMKASPDGGYTFTLTFDFVMPKAELPAGTNQFKIIFWGEDQDHYPYDFSVTLRYLLSDSAATTDFAPLPLPAPTGLRGSPEPQYQYNTTNGAFTVHSLALTGDLREQTTAHIKITGEILSKHILAGTVKYKIYEAGVRFFIAEGNSEYFHCTNKGCNTAAPIALRLADPNSVPTGFELDFDFVVPQKVQGGTSQYKVVVWGQDQDHYPYDFSATVRFDVVA